MRYKPQSLGDLYLTSSLFASLALGLGHALMYGQQWLLLHGTFCLILIFHNMGFYQLYTSYGFIKRGRESSFLLLGQILCLSGLAHQMKSIEPLFLTLIPGLFTLAFSRDHRDRKRSVALLGIIILSFISLIYQTSQASGVSTFSNAQIYFLVLSIWGYGITHFSLIKGFFLRQGKEVSVDLGGDHKDALFFHDLINQTHGLNLLFNLKLSMNEGLTLEELKSVAKENKTIQTLIKDHFKFGHKNLFNHSDVVSFDEISSRVDYLIETFLEANKIKYTLEYQGELNRDHHGHVPVQHAPFIRILTNLIKNISEASATDVSLTFTGDSQGITVLLKNKILHLNENQTSLVEDLKTKILEESEDPRVLQTGGLGLESVSHLCEQLGGQCTFYLEGPFWITRVFLPNPLHRDSEQLAA